MQSKSAVVEIIHKNGSLNYTIKISANFAIYIK
jgi:hypothetical protein